MVDLPRSPTGNVSDLSAPVRELSAGVEDRGVIRSPLLLLEPRWNVVAGPRTDNVVGLRYNEKGETLYDRPDSQTHRTTENRKTAKAHWPTRKGTHHASTQ